MYEEGRRRVIRHLEKIAVYGLWCEFKAQQLMIFEVQGLNPWNGFGEIAPRLPRKELARIHALWT